MREFYQDGILLTPPVYCYRFRNNYMPSQELEACSTESSAPKTVSLSAEHDNGATVKPYFTDTSTEQQRTLATMLPDNTTLGFNGAHTDLR